MDGSLKRPYIVDVCMETLCGVV